MSFALSGEGAYEKKVEEPPKPEGPSGAGTGGKAKKAGFNPAKAGQVKDKPKVVLEQQIPYPAEARKLVAGRYAPVGKPAVTTRQRVMFYSGVVFLVISSTWPLHDIGEEYLYSAHMLQHMMQADFLCNIIFKRPGELFHINYLIRVTIGFFIHIEETLKLFISAAKVNFHERAPYMFSYIR